MSKFLNNSILFCKVLVILLQYSDLVPHFVMNRMKKNCYCLTMNCLTMKFLKMLFLLMELLLQNSEMKKSFRMMNCLMKKSFLKSLTMVLKSPLCCAVCRSFRSICLLRLIHRLHKRILSSLRLYCRLSVRLNVKA